MRRGVFIGLGSNLGDRAGALRRAASRLRDLGIVPLRCSRLYETEAVERRQQPPFLNQVLEVQTALGPAALVEAGLAIEAALGRRRHLPMGPRTLDIDLLLDGDTVLTSGPALVPHPRLHRRRFVLVPLVEIAPQVRHPVLGATMAQLLRRCPDTAAVELYAGGLSHRRGPIYDARRHLDTEP